MSSPASALALCATCGEETSFVCAACLKTHFCSRPCAAKAWAGHRAACADFSALAALPDEALAPLPLAAPLASMEPAAGAGGGAYEHPGSGFACAVCGKADAAVCARCRQVGYCGTEHQRKDWPAHKTVCRKGEFGVVPVQTWEQRMLAEAHAAAPASRAATAALPPIPGWKSFCNGAPPTQIMRTWRKAAEGGHAEAQKLLGDSYFLGIAGVAHDFEAAAAWSPKQQHRVTPAPSSTSASSTRAAQASRKTSKRRLRGTPRRRRKVILKRLRAGTPASLAPPPPPPPPRAVEALQALSQSGKKASHLKESFRAARSLRVKSAECGAGRAAKVLSLRVRRVATLLACCHWWHFTLHTPVCATLAMPLPALIPSLISAVSALFSLATLPFRLVLSLLSAASSALTPYAEPLAVPLIEAGVLPDWLVRMGIRALLAAQLRAAAAAAPTPAAAAAAKMAYVRDLRSRGVAERTASANEQHYEVPAAFYDLCLGPWKKYSCGIWPPAGAGGAAGAAGLAASEEAAFELVVERARLADAGPLRILDMGCGWGSATLYIATRFPQHALVAVSNSRACGGAARERRGRGERPRAAAAAAAAAAATCAPAAPRPARRLAKGVHRGAGARARAGQRHRHHRRHQRVRGAGQVRPRRVH